MAVREAPLAGYQMNAFPAIIPIEMFQLQTATGKLKAVMIPFI